MATVRFPRTPVEIKETGNKFFPKHKSLGENSPLRILTDYDFQKLGDTEYAQWLILNQQADDLTEQARLLREKRDELWNSKIKPPMLEAKKVIVGLSSKTPTYSAGWGFETVKNPGKKEMTAEDISAAAAKAIAKLKMKTTIKETANTSGDQEKDVVA